MDDWGKSNPIPLFSGEMIYSSEVMLFRNDDPLLLDHPFQTSVITAAALNATRSKGKVNPNKIFEMMKNRMRKIILVGDANGNESLVLSVYGCDMFGNDLRDIAKIEKGIVH
jgi:uncharacterized protein (TIGR02452 family)